MKRFRFFTVVLAILVLLPCLASCHGKRRMEPFVMPESFDTSREYEISFWMKNDTNMTQVEIYKKAASDFEALYPNIKVNIKPYTDYGRIYSDIITNISTGTTPNVCITYPDHIATYITGDEVVVPLDDLFVDSRYGLGGSEVRYDSPRLDEMVPEFLDECKINGVYYAIPYMRSTEACYINKTYVEKLGYTVPDVLTWDFIFEVSAAAMEKDANGNFKVNGQKTLIPFMYKSTDNMMIQMLRQKGADYSNEDGDILIFNEDTKEILRKIAKCSSIEAFNTFKRISYPANYLNAGQCIFAVDSTAGATWMGSDAPLCDIPEDQLVQFETVVRTVPQYDVENPQMISQGPSICIFNKEDSQEVLASWLFVQFLLTNNVQISYAQTEGYVPVTLKAQDSDEYKDYLSREGEDNDFYYDIKLKATKLLLENTENTFVTPVFNGSTSLRNAAGELVESVNLNARKNKAIDKFIEENSADENFEKLFDEYIDDIFNDESLEKIFEDTASLYRLDQGFGVLDKKELGQLPPSSIALIVTVGCAWVLIAASFVLDKVKKRKKK